MLLEKSIKKFIKVVSNGIGIEYRPSSKIEKEKLEDIQILSNDVKLNTHIPVEYENNEQKNIQELLVRTQSRMVFQEMKKQQNIDSVIDKSYIELELEEEITSEPLDQDWIIRFFNSIEDISEDHMQQIWAKILVGEIKQPKSISKRSLDVLRNLSKEEAQIFEKVCKISTKLSDSIAIINFESNLKDNNIRLEEILLLSEIGLIEGRSDLRMTYFLKKDERIEIKNNNLIMIAKNETEIETIFDIPVYLLTKTGRELATALKIKLDNPNFIKIMKEVKNKNKNVSVSVHEVTYLGNSMYNYKLDDLLKKSEENFQKEL